MKMTKSELSRRILNLLCAFTLVLFTTLPASAQWTAGNTNAAWNGFNSAYFYENPSGDGHFASTIAGSSPSGFWQQAELIDMAVDAYVWSKAYETGSTTGIQNEINALCEGFVYRNGNSWSADMYNDDLMWATIAFTRAYGATGNSQWLSDAETNFNTVYSRGLASNGGIYWNTNDSYQNSAANWTFVIAGHLLTGSSGNSTYANEAAGVYTWAMANLYVSSTGEILDAPATHGQYTYNYGTAIGAMSESSASATTIGQVATYVFNDLTNYAGKTSGGYNIFPNYGQGATDNDGGYNGILMRWINVAHAHGSIPSADLAAAKANITQAWSIREYSSGDPYYLMWDNWAADTNVSEAYSWDCSSALVGMLDGQGW